ncbi:MAG: glycosyltransferase [Kineothrix sp.]|nr:glycosyltransferase [Kineothrix sp.]
MPEKSHCAMEMGLEMIKFSIIVVCLNAGDRLKRTIESILAQSYGNYEVIVKDGISTDGCLNGLPEDRDGRIRVFREKDTGIYDGMNQALCHVRGEYVYFLNCGDYFYDKDVLKRVQERMEKAEIGAGEKGEGKRYIFYGDIREHLTGERVASNPSMDAFGCYRNVPCHQACFYQARLMEEKGFEVKYKVRADYEHFLWCFFKGGAKTVYMPLVIADYEGGGFSETKENRRVSAAEHKEITGKYMSAGQIWKYRMILFFTLSRLRTWLAGNPATAHVYQSMKRRVYGK